ncbi:MAG: DUF4118 domain-containing protein, partial [Candidatus Dormiibacterota bacterium]
MDERARRTLARTASGLAAVLIPIALTVVLVRLGGGAQRNFVFLFLIVVAFIALTGPFWAALLAAALSFALMDWFFVQPLHTLTIADVDDIVNLLLFFGTAGVIGFLESRRNRARHAAEQLSEQLRRANADLVRLNREEAVAAQAAIRLARTEQQVATLRESERYRRDLLANVSHDLRTPIATILTRSTDLLAGADQVTPGLQVITAEARRLDDLVRDLLDMTRIESGALELDLERIPIGDAVDAAVERLHRRSPQREVRPPSIAADREVIADWSRLGQVLDNLLANADRYGPPGTPLEVEVDHDEPEFVGVRIIDHGPGVAEEIRARIFDRFVRTDTDAPGSAGGGQSGTGLGLAIVRGLVEALAGR